MNQKQKRFCYEYIIDLNATQAAARAGYSPKTAYSTGTRLLKNVEVKTKIQELQNNLAETAQISALRILKEHEKIAFSTIAHMHQTWIERTEFENLTDDQKACIRSISTKIVKKNIGTFEVPEIVDVEYIKVELYDKLRALGAINNMLGFNAPTKQEITGNCGKNIRPEPITVEVINCNQFNKFRTMN